MYAWPCSRGVHSEFLYSEKKIEMEGKDGIRSVGRGIRRYFFVSTRTHVHTTEGEEVGPWCPVSFKVNLI